MSVESFDGGLVGICLEEGFRVLGCFGWELEGFEDLDEVFIILISWKRDEYNENRLIGVGVL